MLAFIFVGTMNCHGTAVARSFLSQALYLASSTESVESCSRICFSTDSFLVFCSGVNSGSSGSAVLFMNAISS